MEDRPTCRIGPKNGLKQRVAPADRLRHAVQPLEFERRSPGCGKGLGGKPASFQPPSAVGLHESVDDLAEIGVVFDHVLDLFDGVHDGRVVLVIEQATDLRVGEVR